MGEIRSVSLNEDVNDGFYQTAFFMDSNLNIFLNNDSEAIRMSTELLWNKKLTVIQKYLNKKENNHQKIQLCFEVINSLLDLSNPFNLTHLKKENKIILLQILISLLSYYSPQDDLEDYFLYLSNLLFHINSNYLEKYFEYDSRKPYYEIDQGKLGLIRSKYYYLSALKSEKKKK